MASIQGSNPLDRLAAYFKPCTRQFSQEEYYNFEDTLSELRDSQPKNPLDNLDVFFQPLAKKFEESNDEILASHNPFVEKVEIGDSIEIAKIKSTRSNKFSTKSSTKRRRVDSFSDVYKSLPSLSTMTTSSDTSSSESSDNEEGDTDTFSSLSSKYIRQDGDDTDLTSETESQSDDNIIEDLKTLSLISDNPKIATTSRKIAKPKSKKQVTALNENTERPMIEKRNGISQSVVVQPENPEGKEKDLWTISKKIEGKCDQKISNKNCTPEVPIAGFIGSRAHKYLDILDNQAFKTRHQKIITKKIQEVNLSGGLSSLLSSGFKPTNMLDE